MSLMSPGLVDSSHRSERTHGTLFCCILVQKELRDLQVGEMLCSSCMASWTPPWAGSPTVSQALRPLQPLTKALMCGWAIHVPTHRVCMNVSFLWFVCA